MTDFNIGDWVYVDGDKSRAYRVNKVERSLNKWVFLDGKHCDYTTDGSYKFSWVTKQTDDDIAKIAKAYEVGDVIGGTYNNEHSTSGKITKVDRADEGMTYYVDGWWLDTHTVYLIEKKAAEPEFKVGDYVSGDCWLDQGNFKGNILNFDGDGDAVINVDGETYVLLRSSLKLLDSPADTPPKREFKVGDRVKFTDKCSTNWCFGPHKSNERFHFGVIAEPNLHSVFKYGVEVEGYGRGGVNDEHIELVEPAQQAEPAQQSIVCLVENGQYKPARQPVVHDSEDAAKAEAERLALARPGKKFAVLKLASTVEAESVLKAA